MHIESQAAPKSRRKTCSEQLLEGLSVSVGPLAVGSIEVRVLSGGRTLIV